MKTKQDSSPLKVGLVQINNSFSGLSYMPYSVGLMQAYAASHVKNPDDFAYLIPVFSRMKVVEAVRHLLPADIVAFSVYVWDEQLSLAIARELKKAKPDIIVVFGGPQVLDRPDEIKDYLIKNSCIDIAIHGEGEKIFASVLENARERSWGHVPSASFIAGKGPDGFVQNGRIPRFKDLNEIPSPYLTKVFEPLIAAYPKIRWIPLWETDRGCPFSCSFCGWGGAVNQKVLKFSMERLFAEVDYFADIGAEYISCADANFGIFDRDVEIAEYVAKVRRGRSAFPAGFSVQNAKNTPERSIRIQKILSDNGLNRGIVLSMQSLDPQTLTAIRRSNIRLTAYEELQRRFYENDAETMTDLILGLSGETLDSFAKGVDKLISFGQHNRIQFNNLSVLPDAEMWVPEYRAKYGFQTVRSRIINTHGFRSEDDEVPEYQELVIATDAMPREDWVKARAFAWMSGFLHFDKVFQIPLIVAHERGGISYRDLVELFLFEQPFLSEGDFPMIAGMRNFFMGRAREVQNGGEEYCHSSEWLDIWWPADEFYMIKLCAEGSLDAFYEEALRALKLCLVNRSATIEDGILENSVTLNRNLLKLPFLDDELAFTLSWNVWEFYRGILSGKPVPLTSGKREYVVDRKTEHWESLAEWCREVIWYGNKRGSYLFGNRILAIPNSP